MSYETLEYLASDIVKLFDDIRNRDDIELKSTYSFTNFMKDFRTIRVSLPRRLGNTTLAGLLDSNTTIYVSNSSMFDPKEFNVRCTPLNFDNYSRGINYNLVICDSCDICVDLIEPVDTVNNKVIILKVDE